MLMRWNYIAISNKFHLFSVIMGDMFPKNDFIFFYSHSLITSEAIIRQTAK